MGEKYEGYKESMLELGLDDLSIRRENICLAFAKKCLINPLTKSWFPINPQSNYKIRNPNTFEIHHANKERLKSSTIPYLQRLLNENL